MKANSKKNYLTKSRFKLAISCLRKMYFDLHRDEYLNAMADDPFMKSLADGGNQVGALARIYYPGGILVDAKSNKDALAQTHEVLATNTNVIIFEGAFEVDGCFVRVDVLIKIGNEVELIEVKSASIDGDAYNEQKGKFFFRKNSDKIRAEWRGHLYDVAFQKYVLEKAMPNWNISPKLLLLDKSKAATVNGLNQKFSIIPNSGNGLNVEIK